MRKKLALLLVLTMILSAIPMNVFGKSDVTRYGRLSGEANSYATVNVDIYDLVEKLGFDGEDTMDRYDNSGIPGIPITLELSDDGASFILDTDGGLADVPGFNIALDTDEYKALAVYAVNKAVGTWDPDNLSKRATVINDNGSNNGNPVTTGAGMTAPSKNEFESNAASALKSGTVGDYLRSLFAEVSEAAAKASSTYITQWTLGAVDADELTFYLQVEEINAAGGTVSTSLPQLDEIDEDALVVNFAVPLYFEDADAVADTTLSAYAGDDTRLSLFSGLPVARYEDISGVTVSAGTLAKFANTGFLDTVSVREYTADFLNEDNTTGYPEMQFRINHPYARLVNNENSSLELSSTFATFDEDDDPDDGDLIDVSWGTRSSSNAYPQDDDEVYDMGLTFTERNYSNGAIRDTLKLDNLMVAFDDRMPYGTELKLQFRAYDDVENEWTDWESTSASVVVRSDNNVQFGLVTERGTNVDKPESDVKGVSGRRDVITEVVRLKENVPNSWNTGTTTFTVPEGTEIVGVHAAMFYTNMSGSSREFIEGTLVAEGTGDNGEYVLGDNEDYTVYDEASDEYTPISRHQNFFNGATFSADANSVTLRPMYNAVTNTGQKREVELQLKLSVEAGYEAKYGADVLLTVDTNEANITAETVKIATIHDPITATLAAEPVTVPVEQNYNVQSYAIGDITIQENTAGDLQQSSELWVYVAGSSATDLTLDADRTVLMNNTDTTLKFYNGVQLRHRFANFYLNGLRFDVQRASSPSAATNYNAPGNFSITNVTITGIVQPNSNYRVVISGSAVAENDYSVWTNGGGGTVANLPADEYANDDTGIFDTEPYTIDAFSWDADSFAPPTAEGPATEGPVATISAPKTFNAYSYSYDTDENGNPRSYNNFYMAAASNGAGYTGISPKAFAEFVGGTTTFDDATRTATITGINQKTGTEVVVTLTLDSTTATINGASTDIATYNNVLDLYPVGSIKPFQPGNNRMYVPVRFMANAFQVDFTWDELTKSVTLYPGA